MDPAAEERIVGVVQDIVDAILDDIRLENELIQDWLLGNYISAYLLISSTKLCSRYAVRNLIA